MEKRILKPGCLVCVYRWGLQSDTVDGVTKRLNAKIYDHAGTFIDFGIDWECTGGDGVGIFSSAIVQTEDGFLELVHLDLMRVMP